MYELPNSTNMHYALAHTVSSKILVITIRNNNTEDTISFWTNSQLGQLNTENQMHRNLKTLHWINENVLDLQCMHNGTHSKVS